MNSNKYKLTPSRSREASTVHSGVPLAAGVVRVCAQAQKELGHGLFMKQ